MNIMIRNRSNCALLRSARLRRIAGQLCAAVLLTVSAGCTTTPGVEVANGAAAAPNIHVAFAGGGWRAHTGHAAWVMSLLDANQANCALQSGNAGNPQCLGSAFSNVATVSANSGGSWFSTMLMYDPDFVAQITNADALSTWGSTDASNPAQGWLGRQQGYFSGFAPKCGDKSGTPYVECVLEKYFSTTSILPTPNWDMFVQNLVYESYDWKRYGDLSAPTRQGWAKRKALLMAGTLLTSSVNLNDNNLVEDEYYYQICEGPNVTGSDGDDGSWCVDPFGNKIPRSPAAPDVYPVTFSSLPEGATTLKAPSFIAAQNAVFHMGYAQAYATTGPAPKLNALTSGVNKTDNVPVIRAAAASSAAAGYAASYWVVGSSLWIESYHARQLALGFSMAPGGNNQLSYVPDATLENLSLDQMSNGRVFRVADGGAIDNSAVAQLISYLQLNGEGDNFNIVAFDEVQKNDSTDTSIYPSSDISYMFVGAPPKGVCIQGHCVQAPDLVVLQSQTGAAPAPTIYNWSIAGSADYVRYYIYDVETVANAAFNVAAGSKGKLHVFVTNFGCADTAPENKNDFACYNAMLSDINTALQSPPDSQPGASTGYEFLSGAFGLE